MKTLESLKKISFREGFFCFVMLVDIVLYAINFVNTPTLESLSNAWFILACFFALCLLSELFQLPSAERAERMQIAAGFCLTLVFLVVLAMAFYYAYSSDMIFTGQFFSTLCLLLVLYGLSLAVCSFVFFHYRKPKSK